MQWLSPKAVLKSVPLALALMPCAFAPAARAQPPAELVAPTSLLCSPAEPAADLAAACPGLPPVTRPQPAASPNGFAHASALPVREDERGDGFYVFGEGGPGEGGPYLAFAPPGSLGVPQAWEFFTGRGLSGSTNWVGYGRWQAHSDEQGQWSPGRRAAVFSSEAADAPCGGFAPSWNEGLKRWLIFYACKGQARVRVSAQSWGPWSEALVLGGSPDAQAGLLASTEARPAAGVAERRTELYWLSRGPGSRLQVFRSTLRQDGAE